MTRADADRVRALLEQRPDLTPKGKPGTRVYHLEVSRLLFLAPLVLR